MAQYAQRVADGYPGSRAQQPVLFKLVAGVDQVSSCGRALAHCESDGAVQQGANLASSSAHGRQSPLGVPVQRSGLLH